ncbi:MAG TPA: FAD-dependent monooxygenase [Actinomycetales bacterium]|nr:FAD-dependent monooxygenase [Actinomycetales bacterium]
MNGSATSAGDRADVLVLGNGPVGQTAALLCARWGLSVLLLDSRPERDPVGSKAICQQRDVLDVWDFVGAGSVAREGVTWSRATTLYRDAELFSIELEDPGKSPLPPFVNISQARTEELLDEAIAEQPLIDVRWGHQVAALEQDDHEVRVRCTTGVDDEQEVELTGSYAIAACGAKGSGVRHLLGVDLAGRTFDDAFLICDIRASLPGWETERRFYFDPPWNPGRQVLIHPCPDSVYRIDWQVEPSFDLEAERASGALDRRIRQVIGDQPYEVVWSSVYRFHSRIVDRMRIGRVMLAGDVAHLVAPFGARGLNSGVGDADNAAWKIAFALRGWAGEDLLETYHLERREAAIENLRVTTATMDFLVPQTPEEHARRRQVLEAALHDEQARRDVDSGRLAEPFWYIASPLTLADGKRPWPGSPERGKAPAPVPGVILPDAPATDPDDPSVTRVRQMCRSGLLVLVGESGDPDEYRSAVTLAVPAGVPVRVVRLAEIDSEGVLRAALHAEDDEVWLVRPDAYIAACVRRPEDLADAVRRALAL